MVERSEPRLKHGAQRARISQAQRAGQRPEGRGRGNQTQSNGVQKRSAEIGVFHARVGAGVVAPFHVEAGPVGLDGFASSTTGDAVRSSQPADGGVNSSKILLKPVSAVVRCNTY